MDPTTAVIRLDRTVRDAQAVLRDHLTSREMSDRDALERLRGILEDEDLLRFQRALEGLDQPPEEIGPQDPLPYR
jgi:hypothetical protein